MPKLSARRQITLPADKCREAGIQPGDKLRILVDKQGDLVLVKQPDSHAIRWSRRKPSIHKRRRLALMLTRLFDYWQLPVRDQLVMLGLSKTSRASLQRYRAGNPLPATTDIMVRAKYLRGIRRSLRLLYPDNRDLACRWMCTPHPDFADMPPIEEVQTLGTFGLYSVHDYLNFQRKR